LRFPVRRQERLAFTLILRIWSGLRNGDDCLAGAGSSTGCGYRSSWYMVVAEGSPRGERSGCLKIGVRLRSGHGVVDSTDEWPYTISLSAFSQSSTAWPWAMPR
jgi:hypothetical protein